MKPIALYAALSALLIGVAAGVLAVVFPGAGARHSIAVSAAIAFTVQLIAFAVLKAVARRNVMAGWGLGALLRLLTIVLYAVVAVEALGLAAGAGLVSLAAFLFLSMLVEPFVLNA